MSKRAASPTETSAAPVGAVSASHFVNVLLPRLIESPTNPRRTYDQAALEELAASIREKGVLQPILVRRCPTEAHPVETFEIVAGSRRYRAAQLAGLVEVPCMVRELTDDQVLECQVIENLQREDVHPLEEAEGFAALIARGIYDVASIADKVGKSERYVYDRLKLSSLIEPIRERFLTEGLPLAGVLMLAKLQPADQALVWRNWKHHSSMAHVTASDIAHQIQREVLMQVSAFPWKASDADLVPSAGACTACARNTANAPLLFPDEKGAHNGLCTDRGCKDRKAKAFLEAKTAEAAKAAGAKAKDVVQLSDATYYSRVSGALTAEHWQECPAGTEGAEAGLMVDSDRRPFAIVQFIRRTRGNSDGKTSEERAADREKSRLSRVETLTRKRVFDAIEQALTEWTGDTAATIAERMPRLLAIVSIKAAYGTNNSVCDSKDIAKHPGRESGGRSLGLDCDRWDLTEGKAKKAARSANLGKAWCAAFVAATYDEIHCDWHFKTPPAYVLDAFAEVLRIDVDAIRKDADWELLSKKAKAERLLAEQGKDGGAEQATEPKKPRKAKSPAQADGGESTEAAE